MSSYVTAVSYRFWQDLFFTLDSLKCPVVFAYPMIDFFFNDLNALFCLTQHFNQKKRASIKWLTVKLKLKSTKYQNKNRKLKKEVGYQKTVLETFLKRPQFGITTDIVTSGWWFAEALNTKMIAFYSSYFSPCYLILLHAYSAVFPFTICHIW